MGEEIEGVEELTHAGIVGEVDARAGGEEVRDDETRDHFDHLRGRLVVEVLLGERGDERGRHVDDARKAIDGQLTKRLAASPITLYCGFDPTADSLHVGHLVPLLALRRFQNYGHHPIAVAGGATGSIGDPSGKSAERSLLTKDQIKANVDAVRPQLAKLLDFTATANPAKLVDNAD